MVLQQAKPITVTEFEQYAALPENVARKLQLIGGEIIEEIPKFAHARISIRLIAWLLEYFKQHPIGEVLNELRVDLPDDEFDACVPDISVIINRRDELAHNDPLPFMPDLVIEIQSEGQTDRHMRDLADYYLQHGARMVWLIYPDRKLVEWLTPTDRILYNAEGTIGGGDVLSGFTLAAAEVFTGV